MSQTSSVPTSTDAVAKPVNRDIPSWAASAGLHLLLLLGMLSVTYEIGPNPLAKENLITSEVEEFDTKVEDYRFDTAMSPAIGNSVRTGEGSASSGVASTTVGTLVGGDVQRSVQRRIEEDLLVVGTAPVSDIPVLSEGMLSTSVETGGVAEKTGGVEGSLDRMTYEIMNSLRDRPTVVVWLFDESPSLKDRRGEITQRFQHIYGQLAALDPTHNDHLKTAIVGFGKDVHFYNNEPTNDIAEATRLVGEMPEDKSGIENVFTALGRVVEKYRRFRTGTNRHNVMIIGVTDERGDDLEQMEKVSAAAVQSGMKVYFVAHSSPFGRQKGYIHWNYDGFNDDIEIDQGPETVKMEVVDLPFWGVQGLDLSRMSSGLGPYHLTRICAETGGIYLITDDHRNGRFDFAVMRNYLPDYRPESVYLQDLKKNKAKLALVETSEKVKDFQQAKRRVNAPNLVFRADTDNALRTAATDAQKDVVAFELYVGEIVKMLEPGEKERAKIKEPRWRAAYDLSYGRALALSARTSGYNMLLASMKVSPKTFAKKDSNTWVLKPSKDIQAGPAVKKVVQKATEMLSRVVDEHAGTPWADLAARELREPMGWEWVEEKHDYEAMARAAANAENRKQVLFADENERKAAEKKKMQAERPKPRL